MMMAPLADISAPWKPAASPLLTVFASDVSPNMTTPYPRPQMTRSTAWKSLNGLWEFDASVHDLDLSPPTTSSTRRLPNTILVPFPVESPLSGIRNLTAHDSMWYRRVLDGEEELLVDCTGGRTLFHIEASDWLTVLYLNGQQVGDQHVGGYDPFHWDISDYLEYPLEILIGVYDPTEKGASNAFGKQRSESFQNPSGIFYSPTSGIYGTVWVECVPKIYIDDMRIDTSRPQDMGVRIDVDIKGDEEELLHVHATMLDSEGSTIVAEATTASVNDNILLIPPESGFQLWSPDTPYLYQLQIDLLRTSDNSTVDSVKSYTGIRTITLGDRGDGYIAPLLNNQFMFQMAILDQGFTPDGNYAFATDEAMIYDIQSTKQLGFNTIRKHIKFESRRWYYHADRLGILVWQDLPSRLVYRGGLVAYQDWRNEMQRSIKAHLNAPSIVQWQTYNEGWGQNVHDPSITQDTVDMVAGMDPTRLINDASGGRPVCTQSTANTTLWYGGCYGHVTDVHHYPEAAFTKSGEGFNVTRRDPKKALVLGEYGGTLLSIRNHEWKPGACFGNANVSSRDQLASLYDKYAHQIVIMIDTLGLSAAVYTQLTDVETECNGLLTYDRIFKVDPIRIKASNNKVISHYGTEMKKISTSKKRKRRWSLLISDYPKLLGFFGLIQHMSRPVQKRLGPCSRCRRLRGNVEI